MKQLVRSSPLVLKVAIGMAVVLVIMMILFNHLATKNDLAQEAYLEYATYSFEIFKVICGMIIGILGTLANYRKEIKAYKQSTGP